MIAIRRMSLARCIALGAIAITGLSGCASNTVAPASTEAPANAPATASAPAAGPRPLIVAATGDGPYVEEDWTLLPQYFAAEKADGRARYLLHVGDLLKGNQVYDDAYSRRVAALYRQSSIPVIFVPGDNEWNDEPYPEKVWPIWVRDFMRFPEQYPDAPVLARQAERPENIAWLDEGVLFIGINLVGGRMHDVEEWGYRHRANADWVDHNLAALGAEAYAAIVFAQAAPRRMHEDFFRRFVPAVEAFGKPVLYLHGDGHVWELEEGWRVPNLTRVQVDQVNYGRPVHIAVSPHRPQAPFSYDRHGAGPVNQEGTP